MEELQVQNEVKWWTVGYSLPGNTKSSMHVVEQSSQSETKCGSTATPLSQIIVSLSLTVIA